MDKVDFFGLDFGLWFIPIGDKPTNQTLSVSLFSPNKPNKPTNQTELKKARLDAYKQKQPFRISIGKSTWEQYNTYDERYNLREILDDEVVIEFDSTDLEIVVKAISQTGINLMNAGYVFEYWDHKGKSPHLHIHNLPIGHLSSSERTIFKKLFIRKYVPLEYHQYVDFSLTGTHLIALEWSNHWKGCYEIKKLVHVFQKEEVSINSECIKCHTDTGNFIIRDKSYCKQCAYEVSK